MNKVTFFNHFHNGDLHISRELVRKVVAKVQSLDPNITFSYAHVNDAELISDIPGLTFDTFPMKQLDQFENAKMRAQTVFINTWYAQQHHKYMNKYGMTIDCLYEAFDETCKAVWKFSLQDISVDPADFYPTIDYSKYHIEDAQTWIAAHPQRKIFVSNGMAMSGQATNFPMTPIIVNMAAAHPDKIFILSNKEGNAPLPANVFLSQNIIKKPFGSDLNENSFVASHCDVIVGRASGAFSYAWTKQNLLERPTKFVCFCGPGVVVYPPHQFWTHQLLSDKIKYAATFDVSDTVDPTAVRRIIERNM